VLAELHAAGVCALLFKGAAVAHTLWVGRQSFGLDVTRPGDFLVRVNFTPYWSISRGAGCLLRRGEWTVARASHPGIFLPFPGGVVRSGSKVGSRRIKSMIASTNDAYCPTLRAITKTALPEGVNSVLEIVINGVDSRAIASAMRVGIDAACRDGVVQISAGNYGGKLGPHHFYLRKIMDGAAP